jgi:hypothetical protein
MKELSVLLLASEAGSAEWLIPIADRLRASGRDLRLIGTPVAVKVWRQAGMRPSAELDRNASLDVVSEVCGKIPLMLVSSATGAPIEAMFLRAMRNAGRPAIAFVDAFTPPRPRLMSAGCMLDFDAVLVIDDMQKREAVAEGLAGGSLVPVGQPAWEAATALPPAEEHKVLFVSQPIKKQYGATLPFDEDSAWSMLRTAGANLSDLQFGYAVHPEQEPALLDIESRGRLEMNGRDALLRYGTVVGMFSSLFGHALAGGRKVISVQPEVGSQDYCGFSRRGLIPKAVDASELASLLSTAQAVEPVNRWRDSVQSVMRVIDRL